jgi:hypothetical protein
LNFIFAERAVVSLLSLLQAPPGCLDLGLGGGATLSRGEPGDNVLATRG